MFVSSSFEVFSRDFYANRMLFSFSCWLSSLNVHEINTSNTSLLRKSPPSFLQHQQQQQLMRRMNE